jgi:hypothetical protein
MFICAIRRRWARHIAGKWLIVLADHLRWFGVDPVNMPSVNRDTP